MVSRRAYELFLRSGSNPGSELEDWLAAERDVIRKLPVDVKEAPGFVSALACVDAARASDVQVGIEPRRLVILVLARDPQSEEKQNFGEWCVGSTANERLSCARFSVVELPAEVDPEHSIAVLSEGQLGIRMLKRTSESSGFDGSARFPARG